MAVDKVGNASTRAKNKWQVENCDRINLVIPKGRKEEIRQIARTKGKSLNGFIIEAVDEKIERAGGSVESPQ